MRSFIEVIYPGYRGPLVMAQNSWIRSASSNNIRLGNHTPHTGKQPHLYKLKRRAHQPKKTNRGDVARHHSTLRLGMGERDFSHPFALPNDP
jgi:hypothetical protein